MIVVYTARWAEDVAGRLEQAVGRRFPSSNSRVVRIVVRADGGKQGGIIGAEQSVTDGLLVQRLTVDDFSGADWEDGLEKFCALFIAGHIAEQSAGRDGVLMPAVVVPEWLSTGLAQYIDPALRARNREVLQGWQREGSVPAFAELLKWAVLPPGRAREKSLCGMAASWLCSIPEKAAFYRRIFDHLRAGESLSPDRLAAAMPSCGSAADLETAWRAWVARECAMVARPGTLSSDLIGTLRGLLSAVPGECGVPADMNWSAPAEPGALIDVKRAAWMPGYCGARIASIRMMEVGRPPEFVEAAELYVAFFEALGQRRRDDTLEKLLARADTAFAELGRRVGERERYMDAMELVYGGGGGAAPRGTASVTNDVVVERSKLQRYIDTVEERIRQAESGATDAGN